MDPVTASNSLRLRTDLKPGDPLPVIRIVTVTHPSLSQSRSRCGQPPAAGRSGMIVTVHLLLRVTGKG
eukprot:2748368-Rhodomonas_salina.1